MAGERQNRPGRFPEDDRRDLVRLWQEAVAFGHLLRRHPLDAAEQLLVLQLLVCEAHQRLELGLVAEPVVAAHLQDLGADEALDEPEHVGVGAALDLGELPPLVRAQESELVDLGNAVRQELPRKIKFASADDVAVDVPANALRNLDALGVAPGIALLLLLLLHGLHGVSPFQWLVVERNRSWSAAPWGASIDCSPAPAHD